MADDQNKDLNKVQKIIEELGHKIEGFGEKVKNHLKNTFANAKDIATSRMKEVSATVSDVIETVTTHTSSLKEKFSGAFEGIGKVAKESLGKMTKSVGQGVISVASDAIQSALSMEDAMNSFMASMGKSTQETERYQSILENIYSNGYGEGFQDIADAMAQVGKNMGDLDDASLQNITESAFLLQDISKGALDVESSTKTAKVMMQSFGLSGEEAMSFLATGIQDNLDGSGELLDSISEYSTHFSAMGLNADDMFKIFSKGADSGAYSVSQIGNAISEMSTRVVDGSASTSEAFSSIGLNATEMSAKFAAGGDDAKDAFEQTIDALAKVGDAVEQEKAGVALFGEAWNEMGPEAMAQLSAIEEGAYATGEEIDKLKMNEENNLGEMFEQLTRSIETLLLPLGQQLLPLLSSLIESIMPIVERALPPLVELFGECIKQLEPLINDILPVLKDLFDALMPTLMELISAVLPVLIEVISALLPFVQILIDLLMPLIDLFVELLEPILALISEALTPLLEALTPIIEVITSLLVPILQVLLTQFSEVFGGIVQIVSDYISRIVKHINLIVDFIKNVFSGNWKEAWNNIIDIFKNIVGCIGDVIKAPINFIIDHINGFIKGINKIKIPDWVPVVGGKNIKLPTIPRLRIGMDYVPSDDFPALLHKGEAVLTAQENALYRSLGGFNGLMLAFSERGYQDARNKSTKVLVVHSHVEVDGREVARSTAEYMGKQLPWEEI